MFLIFVAAVFPIHVWVIFNGLRAVPSWLKSLSLWDLAGALGYMQFSALIESIFVVAGLVLFAIILPEKIFRKRFVSQGTVLILLGAIWALLMHYKGDDWDLWTKMGLLKSLGFLVVLIILASIFVAISEKAGKTITTIVKRLTPLAMFYIVMDLLGLLIIIVRNLGLTS